MKPLLALALVLAIATPAQAQFSPPIGLDPTAWGNAPGPGGNYYPAAPVPPSSYTPPPSPFDRPGGVLIYTPRGTCTVMPLLPGDPSHGYVVGC